MKILPKTTTKYENHYAVGLLWREDNVILPNNKLLALSRLYNLINKFGKDQNIKQIYTETMKDCNWKWLRTTAQRKRSQNYIAENKLSTTPRRSQNQQTE